MATEQTAKSRGVVVGIDGSDASLEALEWAAHQAELTKANLEIVMTWDWPMTYGWAVPIPEGYDPEEDVRKALEQVEADVRTKTPRHRHHRPRAAGPPRPAPRGGIEGGGPLGRGQPRARRVRRHGDRIGQRILRNQRALPCARAPFQWPEPPSTSPSEGIEGFSDFSVSSCRHHQAPPGARTTSKGVNDAQGL